MAENLLDRKDSRLKLAGDLANQVASPFDVVKGYTYYNNDGIVTGTREILTQDFNFNNVTDKGVSGTAPGDIVIAVYISEDDQNEFLSDPVISGRNFSFRSTNSSYSIGHVTVRAAYYPPHD